MKLPSDTEVNIKYDGKNFLVVISMKGFRGNFSGPDFDDVISRAEEAFNEQSGKDTASNGEIVGTPGGVNYCCTGDSGV